nr:12610_t:CDS:2 [Entrophospora candida]
MGKVFYRKGRFGLSTDVIPLIVKNDYKNDVDLLYLKYSMEKDLTKEDFDFGNKAVKQKEIAKKYQQVEEIKEKIIKELEKIENMKTNLGI